MRKPVGLLVGGAVVALHVLAASGIRAEGPIDPLGRVEIAQAEVPADEDVEPEEPPSPPARPPSPPPGSGIEEIVVQGGESEGAVDLTTADAVTGFNAADLEALGAQSIEDLASFTPNLEIVTSGSTTPTFFIRGVGLNDFNANSSGAVAIYQDDVPLNSPALQLGTLFDMERVNVLKGPQGSGPSRNASAGAIKLYSKKPTGRFNGFLRNEIGNYDFRDFEGAVEAPVYEDIIASRLAFRFTQRDGYMKNNCGGAPPRDQRPVRTDPSQDVSICGENVPVLGRGGDGISPIEEDLPTDVNNLDSWAARGSLLFRPTLDQEWTLVAQGARRDEYSRLGQSIGTRGNTWFCDEDIFPTGARRPECRTRGVLGGVDAQQYQPREIAQALIRENRCLDSDGNQIPGACPTPLERTNAGDDAKEIVARQLARNLDDEPYEGDFNRVGDTKNDVWGVSLAGDIVLPNGLDLTTVSGYHTYDRLVDLDLDFTPNPLFEVVTDDEGWQFAQTLELGGRVLEDYSPVRWQLGGFYLMEELDVFIENFFPPEQGNVGVGSRDYTQKLWSAAGYAQFQWDFWNDFTLDGGVRYNWEKKEIDYLLVQSNTDFTTLEEDSWEAPTGTIRLTYRFRDDTSAYWKYTRGWKGGHYNATSSFKGVTAADPETIDAFEAGLKGSYWDGRFELLLNLFHYKYTDYQIFTAQQQLGSQPEFVVLNASDAEIYGADIEASLRPWSGAFFKATVGWLESEFLDFVQKQTTREQRGLDSIVFDIEIQNSGNPTLNSPQFKVALTAEQTVPLGRFGSITGRYDGAWSDDTYFDATAGRGIPNAAGETFLPEDTIGQKSYWLHNVRVGYRTPDGSVELAAWVRNLTDETYKTFAFDGSTFNDITIYFVGEPRTYGVTLTAFFF